MWGSRCTKMITYVGLTCEVANNIKRTALLPRRLRLVNRMKSNLNSRQIYAGIYWILRVVIAIRHVISQALEDRTNCSQESPELIWRRSVLQPRGVPWRKARCTKRTQLAPDVAVWPEQKQVRTTHLRIMFLFKYGTLNIFLTYLKISSTICHRISKRTFYS